MQVHNVPPIHMPSLNDLDVDGTLNTTNQPTNQFISSHKFKICVVYLRMLSGMKAAYIFYFQYSFLEIRIINMYVIIHGSVIIHMCFLAVWWIIKAIQINWLL